MKKNILLMGLSAFLAGIALSCSDNTDDNLPGNKVYFVNGGGEGANVTLYDTGVKDIYDLHLYRSGKYGNAANVKVKILSQAEVDVYNQTYGTNYIPFPASGYSVLNNEVTYNGKDEEVDRSVQIEFDPAVVRTILEGNLTNNYAIPVQIENASVDFNTAKNVAFIRPLVKDPLVYMGLTGFVYYSYKPDDKVQSIAMEFPVKVDFKNLWDITCDIVASQDILDEYNNEEGTFYTLLPSESYTLDDKAVIKNGEKKAVAKLNVDGTKLSYGNYALPVVLKSVSKFEVDRQKDAYLIGIFLEAPKLNRKGWEVIDCNSVKQGDGQGVNAILDGDVSTYWHAAYSPLVDFPHYLVIDMKQEKTITQVDMQQRDSSFKDTKGGKFYISSDNQDWEYIGSFNMKEIAEMQNFGVKIAKGRYLKIVIESGYRTNLAALSEVDVHGE
ncbi:MAG: DUF1735 domain-containing protein [Prevotella sp.]|jgi:hypothetical protein|nr:DUF1735 domain-containing protein [Prevotella sp.]